MAGPCSPSPSGAQSPEPSFPPGFDTFDFFHYNPCLDFDPVKEWLVDPDQLPMPEVEGSGPTNPEGSNEKKNVEEFGKSCSRPDAGSKTTTELGLKEDFLKTSIDEKMGEVTLAEDCGQHDHHHGGDSCAEVAEANVNAGGVTNVSALNGSNGVFSYVSTVAEGGNGAREVRSVSDSTKVAQECDEERSKAEAEESKDDRVSSGDSSSSSSSSSSEEEEGDGDGIKDQSKGKGVVEAEEMEEVEIVASDEGDIRGPIRTEHEVEVLPAVPKIEASLEPHHQTTPVGVISSILASQVIVNGSVEHNPLNEGSILWITERRSPLGLVDEIFGPVKKPSYVVRYNSGEELPVGISVGTAVSVATEFANCIVNAKELHKKGYGASGEHDEEVMDEVEFSDDEKEAEYKRSLQQAERDHKDGPHGNQESVSDMKRTNHEDGPHENQESVSDMNRTNHEDVMVQEDMPAPATYASVAMSQPLAGVPGSVKATLAPSNLGHGNISSFQAGNPSMNAPAVVPAVPSALQANGGFIDLSQQSLEQQPNVVSTYGFPPHQQPNAISTHGFPPQKQPNTILTHGFPPHQQPNAISTHGFPPPQQQNTIPTHGFPPHQQQNTIPIHGFPPHQQQNTIPTHGFPSHQQQQNTIPTHGFPLHQQQKNTIPTHGFPPLQQQNTIPTHGFPPQQQNTIPTHGFPPQQQPNTIPTHGFPPPQRPNTIPTHGFPPQQQPNTIPTHGQQQSNTIPTHGFPPPQQPNTIPTHGFPPQQQQNTIPTHGFPPQQQPNTIPTHGFLPQQQPNSISTYGFPLQQQPNAISTHGFPPHQRPNASLGSTFPPQQQPNASQGNAFPPQLQPTAYWDPGYALQEQPNATWNHGFLPQQQNMGMQGGFLMNVSPGQQPGENTYNHLDQNQAFSSFPNEMLCQQLISSLAALANVAWLGGPVNSSASTMSLGSAAEGNFSQATFGCNNMQEQGAPSFCNAQNQEQPPSAIAQGGIRPPMQFNPRRPSFRGRKPHFRGGRHSFGRGGRQQHG